MHRTVQCSRYCVPGHVTVEELVALLAIKTPAQRRAIHQPKKRSDNAASVAQKGDRPGLQGRGDQTTPGFTGQQERPRAHDTTP